MMNAPESIDDNQCYGNHEDDGSSVYMLIWWSL